MSLVTLAYTHTTTNSRLPPSLLATALPPAAGTNGRVAEAVAFSPGFAPPTARRNSVPDMVTVLGKKEETLLETRAGILKAFQTLKQEVAAITDKANLAQIQSLIARNKVLLQKWTVLKITQSTLSVTENIPLMNGDLQVELNCLEIAFELYPQIAAMHLELDALNKAYNDLEATFLGDDLLPSEVHEACEAFFKQYQSFKKKYDALQLAINGADQKINDCVFGNLLNSDLSNRCKQIADMLNDKAQGLKNAFKVFQIKYICYQLLNEASLLNLQKTTIEGDLKSQKAPLNLFAFERFDFAPHADCKVELSAYAEVISKIHAIGDCITEREAICQTNPIDRTAFDWTLAQVPKVGHDAIKTKALDIVKSLQELMTQLNTENEQLKKFKGFAEHLFKLCEMGKKMRDFRKHVTERSEHVRLFDRATQYTNEKLEGFYTSLQGDLDGDVESDDFTIVDAKVDKTTKGRSANNPLKDQLASISATLWANSEGARHQTEFERVRMKEALDASKTSKLISYASETTFRAGKAAGGMMSSTYNALAALWSPPASG